MARSLAEITADFDALSEADFDILDFTADGLDRLKALTAELVAAVPPETAMPILFGVMERLQDCDLGSPGPLVTAIEMMPQYEKHLIASVKRKPTHLNLLMVNRLLNVTEDEATRRELRELFVQALKHAEASPATKSQAEDFLYHHGGKVDA